MTTNTKLEERFDEAVRPFSRDLDLYLVPNIGKENKFWAIERKTEEILAFIKAELTQERAQVVKEAREAVKKLLKRSQNAPCKREHCQPRDTTANDYNCADMHIGYEELASDALEALSRIGQEHE